MRCVNQKSVQVKLKSKSNRQGVKEMVENFPFFRGYHSEGNAIIDIALLEKWIADNFEVMTPADESDRDIAFKELESGKALDLKEVMQKW